MQLSVDQQLNRVIERLVQDYGGELSTSRILAEVRRAVSAFEQVKITTFVPVLVDRSVRAGLRAGR